MNSQQLEENVDISTKRNLRKVIALLGATLIFLPVHIPNIWGNIDVYVSSYFYDKHGIADLNSTWIFDTLFVGWTFGVCAAGFMPNVRRNTIVFLGLFFYGMSLTAVSYIARLGWPWLMIVVFCFPGFCNGVIEVKVYKILAEISGSSKGKYISIACSGYNFGPLFINLVTNYYMNPDNLAPDLKVHGAILFTDRTLIDKVPYLFILLGTGYFVIMFTGFLMLFFATRDNSEIQKNTKSQYQTFSTEDDRISQKNSMSLTKDHNGVTVNEPNYDLVSQIEQPHTTSKSSMTNKENDCAGLMTQDEKSHNDKKSSTLQTLRSVSYYVITYSTGACIFSTLLVNNSFKTFALLYIKDDKFLSVLGSALSLVEGLGSVAWGFVFDRFEIKNSLVALYAYISITVLSMYFAAAINRYLYFVTTLLVGMGINFIFPSLTISAIEYFGEKNFESNYSLMAVFTAMFSLVVPPIFNNVFEAYGWFGKFCCSSCFSLQSLILTVSFLPNKSRKRKS